jgi:NADH-quinone oxidoreductase subunit N
VIGAYYYLKVVKTMYFDEPADKLASADDGLLRWSGGVLALAVSPLGYFAIPALTAVTAQAAGALF